MNYKATLSLLALVVGLGLWVWLGEDRVLTTQEAGRREQRVLPLLSARDVIGVRVARAGFPPVELQRDPSAAQAQAGGRGGWSMTAPLPDRGDDPTVDRVVNAAEWLQFVERVEGAAARDFPFGSVELAVELRRSEGKQAYVLELGEQRPDGLFPLRVQGVPGVFLVRDELAQASPAEPWAYRRKALFALTGPQITAVVAEGPASAPGQEPPRLALARANGFWRLGGPQGEFADPARVDDLVQAGLKLTAISSANDAPGQDDLERMGLAPQPWASLTFQAGAEGEEARSERLRLGNLVRPDVPGRRFARLDGRPFVYEVELGYLAQELTLEELDGYRARELLPLIGGDTVTGVGAQLSGGPEWRVVRKDPDWVFDGGDARRAAAKPTQDLIKAIGALQIERRLGGKDELDLAALGLAEPRLKLELMEGARRQELHVGERVADRPGVYPVLRLEDGGVFLVDLGLLPERLRDAPTDLVDRELFRASQWDALRVEVRGPEGEALLVAEKEQGQGKVEEWRVLEPAQTGPVDPQKVQRLIEALDQVNVDRYLEADTPEARASYGLDRPTRVRVTVQTYQEDGGLAKQAREFLLGRRDGRWVYALNEERRTPIGRIDAGFLDRLRRGFERETELLALSRWHVVGVTVEEAGRSLLRLTQNNGNWKRRGGGAADQLVEREPIEALLQEFEQLGLTRTETVSPERLQALELAPPRRVVRFTLQPPGEAAPVEKVLALGKREDEIEVWATLEGGEKLGLLFDAPLRALDRYLEEHPPASPFPPLDEDGR